jgi:hypothetical protein
MGPTVRSPSSEPSHVESHTLPFYFRLCAITPGGEKGRERPLSSRSNLWVDAMGVCQFGTAFVTSLSRPRSTIPGSSPLVDPTQRWRNYMTMNEKAWTRIAWWPWVDNLVPLTKTAQKAPSFQVGSRLTNFQFRSLRDPDPVVFLCASAAWCITTVYLLERHRHHPYQYHFLVAGIAMSVLLGALTMIFEELPPYLTITFTPLWISFVMASSTMMHRLL